MLRGTPVIVAAACAIAAACDGTVTSSKSDALGASNPEPATGGGNSRTVAAHPPPSATTTAPNSGAPTEFDCLNGDVGASSAGEFVELDYSLQVCDGSGSDCLDFLVIRNDCSLSLQRHNEPHDAVATAEDCAALARWATSDLLSAAFDDLAACTPGSGNPQVTTEITLRGGLGPRKKMGLCPDEPYASHRACMASVQAKYFPGI